MPLVTDFPRRPGPPAGPEDRSCSLTSLPPGSCGVVCALAEVDPEIERLMSMGVCEGRKVVLVRNGDPLILRVLGTRIGVSARLAERIRVVPCPLEDVAR
jgi:Fe2+ transport system protein FeoA